MSRKSALIAVLHSFIVLAFLFFAASCFAMHYMPILRGTFIENSSSIGSVLLAVTAFLTLAFYYFHKDKYLKIKMGVFAHEHLVQRTIEDFFTKNYAQKAHLSHIDIVGSRIEISVSLPKNNPHLESTLCNMEKGLTGLLKQRFGYSNNFYLIVQNLNIVD